MLHAFLQWDTACFTRMRGMFAAAFWTESRKRLVVARDRMGIKPLYYYRSGDDVYFGSELKAIFEHPEVPRNLDISALDSYLSVNYVPGSRTLIEGIRKLEPGHFLEWRHGKTWIEPWGKTDAGQSATAIARRREGRPGFSAARFDSRAHGFGCAAGSVGIGRDSIRRRCCTMRRCSRPAPLKTFSVSFQGRSFDESQYFRQIAKVYGTDHHEFDLNPDVELRSAIEDFAYYSDEPSADAGALPVWFLSRMTRRHVTVALSGEGADELFGGYLTYVADRMVRPFRFVPAGMRRLMRGALDRYMPVSRREDRPGVQAEALAGWQLSSSRRGALLLERDVLEGAAETDSPRRQRERTSAAWWTGWAFNPAGW